MLGAHPGLDQDTLGRVFNGVHYPAEPRAAVALGPRQFLVSWDLLRVCGEEGRGRMSRGPAFTQQFHEYRPRWGSVIGTPRHWRKSTGYSLGTVFGCRL